MFLISFVTELRCVDIKVVLNWIFLLRKFLLFYNLNEQEVP